MLSDEYIVSGLAFPTRVQLFPGLTTVALDKRYEERQTAGRHEYALFLPSNTYHVVQDKGIRKVTVDDVGFCVSTDTAAPPASKPGGDGTRAK